MLYATWFISSCALGALGVWLARWHAWRRQWLDHPNERSFHDSPTPRIGGLGMLLPVVATTVALLLRPGFQTGDPWLLLLLPALLIATLSFLDDRFDLSRAVRFGGHTVCALIALGLTWDIWAGAPLPLFGTALPMAAVAVLLFLWITGLTNSYNFMDGIDGISGVQALVAVAGWLTVLMFEPALAAAPVEPQELLLVALAGGVLGFLVLNWAPASIFLGDVGSTFLGFYFATLPFGAAALGLPFDRALEAGLFFVWPFVADASLTFIKRAARRERVFRPHRSHLYQVLAATFPDRAAGHRLTSLLFGLLSLLGVGLYWTSGPLWAKAAVLAWVWIALGAWTFGVRRKMSAPAVNFTSPVAKSRFHDEQVDHTLASLMPFEIHLSPPDITDRELRRVREAFASGYIAPVGPQLNAFEERLAAYLGFEEMHALSSGTAAIHLGLRALGVGPGDCVLCPDLTFIASVNPARYLGAEPVLVDVEPGSWAMDPELARTAIRTLKREGRTVRAMVVVHALGIPAPIEALVQIAREEGVRVLEDCAGAFGTRVNGRSVGAFGDAAAFSFNGNKVLTTSGGGALWLRDPKLRVAARSWANQGKQPGAVGYVHETLGYNYKLSNICAAIGLGQLETVDQRLARKAANYRDYRRRLGDIPGISFLPEPAYGTNNYWLACIGLDARNDAAGLVGALRARGIEAAPLWKPMRLQEVNRDLRFFGGTVSEDIHHRFLSLPSGSGLAPAQLARVCAVVREQLGC